MSTWCQLTKQLLKKSMGEYPPQEPYTNRAVVNGRDAGFQLERASNQLAETELREKTRAKKRGKLRTFTPTEGPVHGLVLPEEPEPPGPRRRRLLRDAVRRRAPPPQVQS